MLPFDGEDMGVLNMKTFCIAYVVLCSHNNVAFLIGKVNELHALYSLL